MQKILEALRLTRGQENNIRFFQAAHPGMNPYVAKFRELTVTRKLRPLDESEFDHENTASLIEHLVLNHTVHNTQQFELPASIQDALNSRNPNLYGVNAIALFENRIITFLHDKRDDSEARYGLDTMLHRGDTDLFTMVKDDRLGYYVLNKPFLRTQPTVDLAAFCKEVLAAQENPQRKTYKGLPYFFIG